MTDRYTVAELGLAKGTPRPVAEALLAMERRIVALEAALKYMAETKLIDDDYQEIARAALAARGLKIVEVE